MKENLLLSFSGGGGTLTYNLQRGKYLSLKQDKSVHLTHLKGKGKRERTRLAESLGCSNSDDC